MASGKILSVSLIRFGRVAEPGGVIPCVSVNSSCCAELVAVNNWPEAAYHLSPLFILFIQVGCPSVSIGMYQLSALTLRGAIAACVEIYLYLQQLYLKEGDLSYGGPAKFPPPFHRYEWTRVRQPFCLWHAVCDICQVCSCSCVSLRALYHT